MKLKQWIAAAVSGVMLFGIGTALPETIQNITAAAEEEEPSAIGHVMSEEEAAGQTIPDGSYAIISKLNENYFLDIKGYEDVAPDNTIVQMWNIYPVTSDMFTFTYLGNGFYTIRQYGTDMCLDVCDGELTAGASVQMYHNSDVDAQQWSVEKIDNGYRLRSRCNNFYLDVAGGKLAIRNPVQTCEASDSNEQIWGLIPYVPDAQPVEDGTYTLKSACDGNWYADVYGEPKKYANSTDLQVWEIPKDQFEFIYQGDGFYRIKEVTSGLYVEIWNGGDHSQFMDNGIEIQLYQKTTNRGQLWYLQETDGKYSFISKLNGFALTLADSDADAGSTVKQGTGISQFLYQGTANQQWLLSPGSSEIPDLTMGDMNGDGNCSLPDLIALQKYLLGVYSFHSAQFTAADLDENGAVDVFDLALLKRALLQK